MRPVAISLSPNVEPNDVQRAWYALFNKKIREDNQWVLKAEKILEHEFAGSSAVLTSSGRQAIFRLLKALNIGPGDEVIIQAFTCIAVPEPVLWVGAKPVYADIDPETYNLDPADVRRKINPATKAIIVQHTFGIPGPIEELKKICQQHKLVVIEDMAHGFQELRGDAAILSFGRDKIVSSIFGGAVISFDHNLVDRVRDQQRALAFPPSKWVRQQLLHPIMMDLIVPWYFRAGLGKLWLVLLQKLGVLSKAVAPEEYAGKRPPHIDWRLSSALAYLLVNQLEKLDRYTLRRREIVERYNTAFKEYQPALLRYPLQRANSPALRRHAQGHGMLLGDWYDAALVPAACDLSAFGYTPGSCPAAENAGNKIINLPTYPLLTDEQVERVIAFIKHHDQRNS